MTKYIIRRTSCCDIEKPHKDAIREVIDAFGYRYCSREFLRDELKIKNWGEYENYTVTKDGKELVCCRLPIKKNVWTIEIDDFEKFADENGEIIVFKKNDLLPYREIEIYDDCRE